MIVSERISISGREFIRTFSDSDKLIERDGELYSEAVDPVDSGRTYTESREDIPGEDITGEEFMEMMEGAL